MDSEAGSNEPPNVGPSLTLSSSRLKRARAKLLANLKLCWPKIWPVERSVEALGYSTLIPAFCMYAQDLFDAYMDASDLGTLEFPTHVEAIQKAIVERIAPN